MDDAYDFVFVGSGPHNILNALAQAKAGKRVLMLEQRDRTGGAWATTPVGNIGDMEIGCHIWDHSTEVYDFFRAYLDLDLKPMHPHPRIYFGKRSSRYERKTNFFFLRARGQQLKRGQLGKLFSRSGTRYRISFKNIEFKYPVGGSGELIQKLREKLAASNVQVQLNTPVELIHIRGQEASIQLPIGETSTKQVVLSSYIQTRIQQNGHEIELAYNPLTFMHTHIVLSGQAKPKFSYIRLFKDPHIHRVSDVTGQLDTQGKTILLAGIYPSALTNMSEEEAVQYVLDRLKALRLVDGEVNLESHYYNTYKGGSLTPQSIASIKSLGPVVVYNHSQNFTLDLVPQLPLLRTLLS